MPGSIPSETFPVHLYQSLAIRRQTVLNTDDGDIGKSSRAAGRLNHKVISCHSLHRMTNGTRCIVWREQVCSCSDLPGDIELRFAGWMVRPLINSDCDDHSFRHAPMT